MASLDCEASQGGAAAIPDTAIEYDVVAWQWWERVGRPRTWLAPMVGQSEPAFRMLCRAQGCEMCSTEMIDAAGYARSERYACRYLYAL